MASNNKKKRQKVYRFVEAKEDTTKLKLCAEAIKMEILKFLEF